jgi:lipoprotein-releasing system ATP-binding protein
MTSEVVIALTGVEKSFGEEVRTQVLRGVDLELRRGEFVALTGPSGSGKSTLLNLLGLLDRPTGGRIEVLGTDIATLDDQALTRLRGRTLGFVFQFHHLLSGFTAAENVALPGAALAGRLEPAMLEHARALLALVGLADRAEFRPTQLSGGQQQRVAIARALALDPAIVLADEPTGNLDSASAEEIFALMRRIHHERRTTFLIVTHDRALADRCERQLVMTDGRLRG